MKKTFFTYLSSFLLLIVFSLRIALPLLIHFSASDEDAITQLENTSTEKSPEKSVQEDGTEVWLPGRFSLSFPEFESANLFSTTGKPMLPDEFFSIPTPPPWPAI